MRLDGLFTVLYILAAGYSHESLKVLKGLETFLTTTGVFIILVKHWNRLACGIKQGGYCFV